MIDEQCLNDIGQSDEDAEPDNQTHQTVEGRKNKGKAKVIAKASAICLPDSLRSLNFHLLLLQFRINRSP